MVSGSITAEEAHSLSLPDLRRREYLSLRSLLHHSSLTSAAFAGALADPTGLLLIAALAAAAKEGIDGYEEWKYLAVLQGEVRRRGLEPCKATAMDQLETFFATFVGQEVQQVLGPGSDQFGDAAGEYAYDHMVEKAAQKLECFPGGPPPNGCVRRNVKTRLQCDDCRTFFDTRFDSYSHCCICGPGGENFDICAECQKKRGQWKCNAGHDLYKPRPEVSGSLMGGIFGIECNGCGDRIRKSEFYTCRRCLGDCVRFDMCLKCYSQGKICGNNHDPAKYKRESV